MRLARPTCLAWIFPARHRYPWVMCMKFRRQALCLLVLGVLIWFLMDAQSVRSAALEALELCARLYDEGEQE